jgi:hypothetical protein
MCPPEDSAVTPADAGQGPEYSDVLRGAKAPTYSGDPPFVPLEGRIRRLWYGSSSMAALADLERLLERVFERSTARLFRSHIQVVQVERKVERAMERARTPSGAWTIVPSRYRVRLDPGDLEALAADVGGAEALAARLADVALAFARAHAYHLAGRPSVALVADPSVDRGVVEVDAIAEGRRPGQGDRALPVDLAAQAPATPKVPDMPVVGPRPGPVSAGPNSPQPSPEPPSPAAPAAGPQPVAGIQPGGVGDAAQLVTGPPAGAPHPEASATMGGIRGDGTQTLVFRRSVPDAARASVRLVTPDGVERVVEVNAAPVTLGRSSDNVLVLADSRVSRHHGRIQMRRLTLVYTDLASTNGSRVNGVRVDECALGVGDRVVVGDTVLLVEQLPN